MRLPKTRQLLAIMLATLIVGCDTAELNFKRYGMYQSLAHDKVVVVELAEPLSSHAPSAVRISLVTGAAETAEQVLITEIANNGGAISSENVRAEWLGTDTFSICLSGTDQEDEKVEINVIKNSHSTSRVTCAL